MKAPPGSPAGRGFSFFADVSGKTVLRRLMDVRIRFGHDGCALLFDSNFQTATTIVAETSLRANGSGECAPDDRLQKNPDAVIPGRCEASNPESRDSGSGPSDHPGMTASRLPLSSHPDIPSRSRGALRPSCAFIFRPREGVGNVGCPLHPRPRVHLVLVESTRVTTSTPESPGIPARNGFNGFPSRSPR
jgi:hypothetical protein